MENKSSTWTDYLSKSGRAGNSLLSLYLDAGVSHLYSHWPGLLKRQLRTILQTASPMLLLWGKDRLTFHNNSFLTSDLLASKETHCGLSADESLGTLWGYLEPALKEAENKGAIVQKRIEFEGLNYKKSTWTGLFMPVFDNEDEVSGFTITFLPLSTTDVNEGTMPLPLSSEMIQVLDSINEGFFTRDVIKEQYIHLSEGCPRIYGYTVAEFFSNPMLWFDVIYPEDIPIAIGQNKVLEQGRPSAAQYRIIHRDKSIRWIEIKVLPIFSGNILSRVNGIINDITERKKAELEIVKQKEQFKSIINSLPGIFYLAGSDGKLITWNKNFETVSGFSASEIETMNPMTWFSPQEKEVLLEKIEKLFREGKSEVEAHLITKNGNSIPYFFNGRIIEFEGKSCLIGMGIDISARKQVEEEREKVTLDLIRRNIDLKQFSYIVSHNLRSPINKILGLASLIKTSKDHEDPNIKLINYIVSEATNLDNVVKDLTTIVSFQDLGVNVKEDINFKAELELLIQTFESEILETKAIITYDFSKPDGMNSIRGYFYSILYNLISNALKYRHPERVPIIHLDTFEDEKYVYLVVKDNGSGIDLKKHGDKIFELYTRFHPAKIPGKGMGLNLVKTQAETLGGSVSIESKPDIGSIFTVSFLKG